MDLQRNLGANLANEQVAFDVFAPGWRSNIDINQSQQRIRQDVFAYWQTLISGLGVWPSAEIKLITGTKSQPLYWLLLAARHELAHKFWETAANRDGQGKLF
jgi:three-Cys-motif partner protein